MKTICLLVTGVIFIAGFSSTIFAGAYINVVNVKDYGATGNGSTDDTAAIRTAIAAAGSGTLPRIVFFPAGRYVISKPIFIGAFSSSGNGQGSFSWAGETSYWGGSIANAKEGIHLVGETSALSNQSEIVFKRTDGVSCPMLVIIGAKDIKIEKMQINGQYVAGNSSYARASEGIFATAGTYGLTVEQSNIINCKRGYRGGNNVHWPEDPITFTNYETQNDYPTTTGGWTVEQIVVTATRIQADICVSQETAGTNGFQTNNLQVSVNPSGYAVYLQAGSMTFVESSFMGGAGVVDIYVPVDCGRNTFQILGGHSETQGSLTFKKDRSSGETTAAQYAFKHWNSCNKSIEIQGSAQVIIEDGDYNSINLLTNANNASGALQIVDIRDSIISGKVGQNSNAASGAKVVFSAENTLFTGYSDINTPFNAYFDAHSVNKLENCKFIGSNFTSAVLRLNYQGVGVFSGAMDGGSHFSLGGAYGNTNTLFGAQNIVATMVNAYRKDGSLYAASTSGSKLNVSDSSLTLNTFSGETADTPVDSLTERFAVGATGGIWTSRINGHRTGWNSSAPASGTWSQGDVIWNSAVTVGGTQGWVCVAGGTPGTWDIIGRGTGIAGDLDNDGAVDFKDFALMANNWLIGK